jgi:3-dehydroquinate synthase
MFEINIKSSIENYRVTFKPLNNSFYQDFDLLLVDNFFRNGGLFSDSPVVYIEATEQNKTLSSVERICEELARRGLTRNSRILAIGGGVVQDLATIVASVYMRGISWSYAPSTLTGMVDSCVGGKSSINVGAFKNLVGNVYPPKDIFIDARLASTLRAEEICSGLSEAGKIIYARDPKTFKSYLSGADNFEPSDVATSLEAKKWFVEKDEFDVAERQLLNFGHTFGHAFEAATNFSVQHGVAVAIGMLSAIHHPDAKRDSYTSSLEIYALSILKPIAPSIIASAAHADWGIFESALKRDKKNSSSALCHILPVGDGALGKVFIDFNDGAIDKAIQATKKATGKIGSLQNVS